MTFQYRTIFSKLQGRRGRLHQIAGALALVLWAGVAGAVHPQAWTHQAQGDYTDGQFDNVVVDNYGELTLGRALKKVAAPADTQFVNGLAQTKDGAIYFITAQHGKVCKLGGDKPVEIFTAPADRGNLLCLAVDANDRLLVGACGPTAQLLRLPAAATDKPTVLFDEPEVAYIWAIAPQADGTIYLATGPHGQVWKVPAEGKPSVVLETKGKNILALRPDAQGNLLAGTDGQGLVIRLDAKTGKPVVLLDAGNADVTALALDEAGNIYAAAGQPADAHEEPPAEESGAPAKPGKVEPDLPDVSPAPDPVEENASKPKTDKNIKNDAPAKKEAGSSSAITLPGGGILADNSGPDSLKALLANFKAREAKHPASAPKHRPHPGLMKADKAPHTGPHATAAEESESGPGNAVYKIAPDGTTQPLLHLPDTPQALLYHAGELLIGTGSHGRIYSARPTSESQALIARVTDENIITFFAAADGTIYLGTSDNGEVFTLSAHPAARGTYLSKALNAGNTAAWGTAILTATTPPGTTATIATRSGNVEDVETQGNLWNDWSEEISAAAPKTISNPAARYLQYRITLATGAPDAAPTVSQVRLAYQVRNLPPVLKNVSIDTPGAESGAGEEVEGTPKNDEPTHTLHVYWDASDPNHDELTYRILYRQVGTDLWVQLAKDLKDPSYDWNTKEIPDGKYQIKVIASDAADNTPQEAKAVARITPIIIVNNTPPAITELKALVGGDKTATVSGHAADTLSPITDVRYRIDGEADWHPAAASDKIFDSPAEGFAAVTRVLAPGTHRITVKAADAQGNVSYQALTLTVP